MFMEYEHDHEYEEKMDIDTDIDTAMERWHSTETFKSTEINSRRPIYMGQNRFYWRDSTIAGIVRIWGLSWKDDMLPFLVYCFLFCVGKVRTIPQ